MTDYNVADFLPENVEDNKNVEINFKRFKLPFIIKPLTGEDILRFRKMATERGFNEKTHVYEEKMNTEKLSKLVLDEAVVQPDLHSQVLLEGYGIKNGNSSLLLERMLNAGEYSALINKVNEVSGLDDPNEVLAKDEAKN